MMDKEVEEESLTGVATLQESQWGGYIKSLSNHSPGFRVSWGFRRQRQYVHA